MKIEINGWYIKDDQYYQVTLDDIPELSPIPLTPELLKKIGFRKEVDEYIDKTGQIRIREGLTNRPSPYDWYVHIDNQAFETIGSLDLAYLHELQAILKLCGYEELLDIRPF